MVNRTCTWSPKYLNLITGCYLNLGPTFNLVGLFSSLSFAYLYHYESNKTTHRANRYYNSIMHKR